MSSSRTLSSPIWLPALLASGVAMAVPQGGINPPQARASDSALSAIRLHDPATDPQPTPVDDLAIPPVDPLLVKDAEPVTSAAAVASTQVAPTVAAVAPVVSSANIAHEKWTEIALPTVASSAGQASVDGKPAVVAGVAAEAAEAAPSIPSEWVLNADDPIHVQLQAWAKQAGWRLEWKLKRSWVTPAPAAFHGPFDQVVDQVISGLYAEGKPVHLALWTGNKYAEVTNVDVR